MLNINKIPLVILTQEQIKKEISDFFSKKPVDNVWLFGSYSRGEADENSDVDVLVEFKGKATFDLFMDLKFYLEDLLGTKVDLVTDKAIRNEIRNAIEAEKINVA